MARPGKKAQRLNLATRSLSDLNPGVGASEVAALPIGFDRSQPEKSYRDLVPLAHRKRFAQFFTPEPVAQLMIDWVFQAHPVTILDPSVGPGVFLRLIGMDHHAARVLGIDVDPVVLAAARTTLGLDSADLIAHDFLTWPDDRKFDGILANPPYLRHHDIHYPFDIFAEVGRRSGVIPSKLANIYVLFVLEICRRLSPGGRAAVIVPGEWTNANFGMTLKRFLLLNGLLHSVVYFSNLSDQFEDALTTAAILLIEKPTSTKATSFDSYFVEHSANIADLRPAILEGKGRTPGVIHRKFFGADLVGLEKWDKVLKDGMAEQQAGFVPLGSMARSRRGIATGANEFFHLTATQVRDFKLRQENLKPCVGRSEQVSGLRFTPTDFEQLEDRDGRVWLLSFALAPTKAEEAYIQGGVADGLNERFLLAGRKPWYSMEQRAPAPIWAAAFGRKSLRFVHNEAGVSNLTTFHCIYPTNSDPVFCRALVACLNSRVVQEMAEHQRRVYGGGLLKFEPKDLLSIQVPNLAVASTELVVALAQMLDRMDSAIREIGAVPSEMVDELDELVRDAACAGPQAALA
jgi:adenine-specific DNA-methyltransferase